MSRKQKRGGPARHAAPSIDRGALLKEAAAHAEASRPDLAAETYRRVLEHRPTDAEALAGLGQVTGAAGDVNEGIALLRRAIASYGRQARYHVQLAALLGTAGRLEESVASARRAITLEPRNAQARTLLAMTYSRLNRVPEGIAAARKCMEIADGADVRIILANLLRRNGDLDEARDLLEPVIAKEQRPSRLAGAWHELGFIFDGLGEYDAAFDAFSRAGAEDARQPAGQQFDPTRIPERVERYRRDFTAERLQRAAQAGSPGGGPAPAFLVGFPRSGTTMTEQVLASHPRLLTSGEEPHFQAVLGGLHEMSGGDPDFAAALERLEPEQIADLRERYWAAVRATLDEGELAGRLYVDKMPMNITELGIINMVFPDSRIIFALRDPRDVCLSCLMQRFQLNEGMLHFLSLEGSARLYDSLMGFWLDLRDRLTVPWIEVRYEDTVSDLEKQARRILDHLGVEWDPGVLAFHERAKERYIGTPSWSAVGERIYTRAVARWRRYAKHIDPVTPMLAPYIEAFGYDADPV